MTESTVFVQLSVGFILLVTGVRSSCPIELSPPTVVVKHGDPVSVNCTTSESGNTGMGWEASQGGIGVTEVKHLLWTVEHLTEWEITPMCVFTSAAQQCQKSLNIIIYRFPENISISSNSRSKNIMKAGENYIFTCSIFDIAPIQNLNVRWYKGDKIIQTDDPQTRDGKKPSSHSSVLSYTPNTAEHNVTFRCEAYMDLGPEGPQFNVSSQEYDIVVFYGPLQTCPDTYAVQENSHHKVTCTQGFPPPVEVWYKDGVEVDLPDILTRNESGLYLVDASGTNSRINFTVNITVLYGPEWICVDTYIVEENSHHKFTCSQGFPPPEETWYHDGEEVDLPEILTKSESGMYWVNASNINSWITLPVNIIVLYPPSPIDELEDSEVQVGDTLRLKCSSKGNPMPDYSWSYFYMPNVKIINEDGVSFLIIHNATGNNIGSYTCNATNEGGCVSKTVRVTVKGAKSECPIEITPDQVVLRYQGEGEPVTCEPLTTDSRNVKQIYWKTRPNNITTYDKSWLADTLKDWDPRPVCYAEFHGKEPCQKHLKYILFKTPDRVSISAADSLTMEGSKLPLQCEIYGVAPAQNLRVRWMGHKGNDTIMPVEANETKCNIDQKARSPVNVWCTTVLTLNRTYNAMKVWCEAQLDLGPKTPPLSPMKSNLLNITVLYKPTINTTKLPERVPVFRGYHEELVCEADGNPPANITWSFSSNTASRQSDGKLRVFEAGLYNCTATNFNSTNHVVTVILEEDYLPLIAGFVAVTVVAISVIFLFIYSIYYKNTKMRRYNFKNPKLSTQNGNVAHNGWDLQFPMTKLS